LDDLGNGAAEVLWFNYIEIAGVKRAKQMSDLVESDNGGGKRIFRIKKSIGEPDVEEEGIAMFGGRYRLFVGTCGENKAIANDDNGTASAYKL
jgi:hypothetical protein